MYFYTKKKLSPHFMYERDAAHNDINSRDSDWLDVVVVVVVAQRTKKKLGT